MAEMRFKNKGIFITGAAKGIGRAAAEAFAAEGGNVALADVDDAEGEAIAKAIVERGGQAVYLHCDVSKASEVRAAVEKAEQTFGGLNVIFSNAGIAIYSTIPEMSEEDFEKQISVNFRGQFHVCKYGIQALRRRGGGAVICTASVQAFATQRTLGAYSATKAATSTMVKTMALDHALENITVNCICPGSVNTPLLRYGAKLRNPDDPDSIIKVWGGYHPIGRVIEPEEVAALVLFLASDQARAITGTSIPIDGGLLAAISVPYEG